MSFVRQVRTRNGKGEEFLVTVTLDESRLMAVACHQASKAMDRARSKGATKGRATAAQGFVVVDCERVG